MFYNCSAAQSALHTVKKWRKMSGASPLTVSKLQCLCMPTCAANVSRRELIWSTDRRSKVNVLYVRIVWVDVIAVLPDTSSVSHYYYRVSKHSQPFSPVFQVAFQPFHFIDFSLNCMANLEIFWIYCNAHIGYSSVLSCQYSTSCIEVSCVQHNPIASAKASSFCNKRQHTYQPQICDLMQFRKFISYES